MCAGYIEDTCRLASYLQRADGTDAFESRFIFQFVLASLLLSWVLCCLLYPGFWFWGSGLGLVAVLGAAQRRQRSGHMRGSEILFNESTQKPLFILHLEKSCVYFIPLLHRCFPEPVYRCDFVSHKFRLKERGICYRANKAYAASFSLHYLHTRICSSNLFRYSGKANIRVHGIWHGVSCPVVYADSSAEPVILGTSGPREDRSRNNGHSGFFYIEYLPKNSFEKVASLPVRRRDPVPVPRYCFSALYCSVASIGFLFACLLSVSTHTGRNTIYNKHVYPITMPECEISDQMMWLNLAVGLGYEGKESNPFVRYLLTKGGKGRFLPCGKSTCRAR